MYTEKKNYAVPKIWPTELAPPCTQEEISPAHSEKTKLKSEKQSRKRVLKRKRHIKSKQKVSQARLGNRVQSQG